MRAGAGRSWPSGGHGSVTLRAFAKKSAAHLAWRRETMQRSQAASSDSHASLPAPGPLTDAAAIRGVHHPAPSSRGGSKAAAAAVPIKTQPCDGLKPEQKKAEIRAPGADFAKKRRVAGFLSYLARSAPIGHNALAIAGGIWLIEIIYRQGHWPLQMAGPRAQGPS